MVVAAEWLKPSSRLFFYTNMSLYNIELCLKMMNMIGVHPEKRKSHVHLLWFGTLSLCLWFEIILKGMLLRQELESVAAYIEICYSISFDLYGVLCSVTLFVRRSSLSTLIRCIRNEFWPIDDIKATKSDEAYFKSTLTKMRISFFILLTLAVTTVTVFIGYSLSSTERSLLLPMCQPSWLTINQMLCIQVISAVLGQLTPLLAIWTLFMTITTLTTLQFRLIKRALEDGLQFTENQFSLDSIRKILEHQAFMLRFTADINEAFAGFLLGYVGIMTLAMCLQLYIMSVQLSLKIFLQSMNVTALGMFHFMIFLVLPSQDLSDEIESIGDTIYFSEWYKNDQLKHIVIMMIKISQKRVAISAAGLMQINMNTGLQIIKSMLSYCAFLRTISLNE